MSIQFDQAPTPVDFPDWELDITIVEAGPEADKVIRMTDDNCGTTCQTACTSCP